MGGSERGTRAATVGAGPPGRPRGPGAAPARPRPGPPDGDLLVDHRRWRRGGRACGTPPCASWRRRPASEGGAPSWWALLPGGPHLLVRRARTAGSTNRATRPSSRWLFVGTRSSCRRGLPLTRATTRPTQPPILTILSDTSALVPEVVEVRCLPQPRGPRLEGGRGRGVRGRGQCGGRSEGRSSGKIPAQNGASAQHGHQFAGAGSPADGGVRKRPLRGSLRAGSTGVPQEVPRASFAVSSRPP